MTSKAGTQVRAEEIIKDKLDQIHELMRQCQSMARKNEVDFYFESPCGRTEHYDGQGIDGEAPTGWDHSQC